MPTKREPVKWKYPSEELLHTPSPYNTPEYREHLEATEAYGITESEIGLPCYGQCYRYEDCEDCFDFDDCYDATASKEEK